MKITHLCLGCFYIDDYSYQENLLPKFHKKMGHEVEIIASMITFDKNGDEALMEKSGVYYNEHEIKVTRLNFKKMPSYRLNKKLKKFDNLYQTLENSKTDILFIHGCQFLDMKVVVKYLKRNNDVKVFVDNHADFSNSATNWVSKNILHKILWRRSAQLISPFTTKFYGVLPARVKFLVDMYKLSEEKVELLVMGADDDIVNNDSSYQSLREKLNIADDDFLIVTGGKVDAFKKQILLLMEAVKNIETKKIKLVVFGSVTTELKEKVNQLCDNDKVQYIGWISSKESYDYFEMANLVVFPGRHSVFWEQVTGQGIPMLVKYWDGTTHIDLGGNVDFLYKDSTLEIQEKILSIYNDDEKYLRMKKTAEEGRKLFSYEMIARKSIEN